MAEVVLTQARGQAVQITINRPDRHNAINEALCAGLAAAIDAAESDRTVRAIVLTGAGDRVFCAGGDLKPSDDGSPFAFLGRGQALVVVAGGFLLLVIVELVRGVLWRPVSRTS